MTVRKSCLAATPQILRYVHLAAGIAVLLTLGTVTCGDSPQVAPKEVDPLPSTNIVVDKKQLPKMRGEILGYLRSKIGKAVQAPPAPAGNADVWCIKRYESAKGDKKILMRLMAEDLALAGVLALGDVSKRTQSVSIGIEASRCALVRLDDKKLAPAIIDVYVLPLFLDLSTDSTAAVNQYGVLQTAGHLYQTSGRFEQALSAYRTLFERAPNRNMADFALFKVAQVHQAQKNFPAAIQALAEISDFDGMAGAKSLQTELRDKLRAQQKERNCCNVD